MSLAGLVITSAPAISGYESAALARIVSWSRRRTSPRAARPPSTHRGEEPRMTTITDTAHDEDVGEVQRLLAVAVLDEVRDKEEITLGMHGALQDAAQLATGAAGYARESNDSNERQWWLRMLQAAIRFGRTEHEHD